MQLHASERAVDDRLDTVWTLAAAALRGKAAIAGTRLVFAHHAALVSGPRWAALAAAAARSQWVLWACTSVKTL